MLKTRNLCDFNGIYNIHNVFILGVILEYRWQKIKDEIGFDPRCFMSWSNLSGAIERIKSKLILTYPRNVEVVDLMESLLSGGYSSARTRLGFDTKMFASKSAEYMKQNDGIIEQLRNLYSEKKEKTEKKRLKQLLYDLFKQEDLTASNKPIYSLHLDGDTDVKKRRVVSKISKIDKSNQYEFAMTKPLRVGIY